MNMIKVYVLVSFYDDTGLHKAGTIAQVPEDEFNPLYMKKLPDIPTGSSDLADLDDVNLTDLDDGEILIYQSSTGKWINGVVPAGAESLSELNDVDVASAANGNVLTYDSTEEEWKAAAPAAPSMALNDLSNVDTGSPTNGKILTYESSSSSWKAKNAPTPSVALSALTDVGLDYNLQNGQVLTFDSTNWKWKNATPSGGGGSLASLSDVNVTNVSNGDSLVYNNSSSKWVSGGGRLVITASATGFTFANASPNQEYQFPAMYSLSDLVSKLTSGGVVYFKDPSDGLVAVTSCNPAQSLLGGTYVSDIGTINAIVFKNISGTNWSVMKKT